MGCYPHSMRVLALLLPLLANASPLVTTTSDQVLAATTGTAHDGAPNDSAAEPFLASGTATTVVNGAGNTFVSGPYATPTGPIPDATVLAPAVHPDVDPLDVVNIQLTNSANLFYSDPNPVSADVSVAFVTIPQMDYHSVVLDHSLLVTGLTCSSNFMSMNFTTNEAFNAAQANWTLDPFVVITSDPGCASPADQHNYILVNNVSFSTQGLSATLSTSYINITEAVGASNPVTVDLGNLTLSHGNEFTGFTAGLVGGANLTSDSSESSTPSSSDFDVSLDQSIGFLDVNDETYWSQLYPGTIGETDSDFEGEHTGPVLPADSEKRRRFFISRHANQLSRRGWFDSVVNFFDDAVSTVVEAAKSVADAVSQAARATDIKNAIVETAAKAYDALNPFTPHTFTPIDDDLNFATPQGSDSTPWGAGQHLYSQAKDGGAIAIYCVGCGAKGTIHVKGTITFNVGELSVKGSLNAAGTITAALALGIVASYTNTWSYEKEIANVPLSPLSIPGVLTIGPQIVLSAGGGLTVSALGQLLAGTELEWPEIQANIDIASPGSSSASGFAPNFTPIFDVAGSISATADAYLTVSVGFGIDILAGTISKQVALVEKPDISITAATSFSAVTGFGSGTCDGVSLNLDFNNYVYADLAGTEFNINTLTLPIASKCLTIPTRRSLSTSVTPRTVETTAHGIQASRDFTANPRAETSPTLNYTVLNAADGSLEVHWAYNGNLYAVGTGSTTESGLDDSILFSTSDGSSVLGDSDGRLLHGYVDTLNDLGVSRLRLADGDSLPITSVMLTLAPVDPGTGPSIMMAFDTAGNSYYPLLCVYEDLYPKIFIATDPDAGSTVLEDPANIETLTGGTVTECGFFAFGDGAQGDNDL